MRNPLDLLLAAHAGGERIEMAGWSNPILISGKGLDIRHERGRNWKRFSLRDQQPFTTEYLILTYG
jgi:hypothetical protein